MLLHVQPDTSLSLDRGTGGDIEGSSECSKEVVVHAPEVVVSVAKRQECMHQRW